MPYIESNRRPELKQYVINFDDTALWLDRVMTAGELNYAVTELIISYVKRHNNYQGMNDIVGALDNAKDEFKRRWQNPHEDYKISQNGDVYPTGG